MVKADVFSAAKANRLFWLARYENRVYLTIHQLNKCFDMMIDGHPDEYSHFWEKLDASGKYQTSEEFTLGMLYDEDNPCSVISAQRFAMDNAILLREDIMSETLSYLEMSMALMRKCKHESIVSLNELQPIIDWSLAFWGSAEQRLQNPKALVIMLLGRNIESLDMQLRFAYPFHRIALTYIAVKHFGKDFPGGIDESISAQLDELLTAENYDIQNDEYKNKVIKYVNQLVRV